MQLSLTMQKTLETMQIHGDLIRYECGLWSWEDAPMMQEPFPIKGKEYYFPEWCVDLRTLRALDARGYVGLNETNQICKLKKKYVSNKEKLESIIDNNFKSGDTQYMLTYNTEYSPCTKEQAQEDIIQFKRRLRQEYSRAGKNLKYINSIEYENGKVYHRLLINIIPGTSAAVLKNWKKGVFVLNTINTSEKAELAECFTMFTDRFAHSNNLKLF